MGNATMLILAIVVLVLVSKQNKYNNSAGEGHECVVHPRISIFITADLQLVSELFENEHADDADNPSDYQDDCDTGQYEQWYPNGCDHPYPRVWELAPDFQECQYAGQQQED